MLGRMLLLVAELLFCWTIVGGRIDSGDGGSIAGSTRDSGDGGSNPSLIPVPYGQMAEEYAINFTESTIKRNNNINKYITHIHINKRTTSDIFENRSSSLGVNVDKLTTKSTPEFKEEALALSTPNINTREQSVPAKRPRHRRRPHNIKKHRRNYRNKARWPTNRRRNYTDGYNRGNRTSGRPPKRNLKNGAGGRHNRRRNWRNYPNRRE